MAQYNNEKLIKKPSQEVELTPDQQAEWIKCANDKLYWMQTYAFVEGQNGKELFTPRPYQLRFIDGLKGRWFVALCGRQAGKTTTLGLDKLHDAIFMESRKIGITSYKLTNCRDYIKRIKFAYEHLPFWMKPPVEIYNVYNIEFTNKSVINSQVTTEDTFRGITLTDIIVDEFSFVKESIASEFWASLLPSISAGGTASKTKVAVISTPNGSTGQYAALWFGAVAGKNGFTPHEAKYDEIPGRDEAFEKAMISKIGKDKFDQEFKNKFISNKGTLIHSVVLEGIKTIDPISEYGDLRIFVNSLYGRKIGMACDVSEGIGQDAHAIQLVDIDTLEQIGEYQNSTQNQTMYTKEIIKIIRFLFISGATDVYYTIENNSIGAGVMRLIENTNDPIFDKAMLVSEPEGKRLGIFTTSKNKLAGCSQLKDLIEMQRLKINSVRLKTELQFFVKSGISFKAEAGTHDDLVMAMVLMMNMFVILANYEDNMYETMNEIQLIENEADEVWGIEF